MKPGRPDYQWFGQFLQRAGCSLDTVAVNQPLPVGLLGILEHVFQSTPLRRTQRQFLTVVLSVFLAVPGRLNALNLSRYAGCSDRTIRRWLHRTDEGAI